MQEKEGKARTGQDKAMAYTCMHGGRKHETSTINAQQKTRWEQHKMRTRQDEAENEAREGKAANEYSGKGNAYYTWVKKEL